ncbi:cytochrome c biogenesis protein CcdA [Bacteroidota bacterium]
MRLKLLLLTLLSIILIWNPLSADDKKPVVVTAQPSVSEVKAGEEFTVRITLKFEKTWYTYDIIEQVSADGIGPTPTEITFSPEEAVELVADIIKPEPQKKYDDGFEMDISYFKGEAVFEQALIAKKDLNFESDSLSAVVYMQLCDPTKCLPPEEFFAPVSSEPFAGAGGGIFSFLWIAISAGALALLTPCVFPMVPITVSFFAKRSETAKGKGLRDALVYAIGIIITFTSLGFIFSVIFGASGIQDFAKSPGVYLFIAGIFLLFTFNLFGAYEIQMPTGLMNKLNAKSMQGSGVGSVILMGLTFSLASFSCTGPLVGAALIAASTGEWFYPIISMLGFSATLALPFFFLALFPSALSSMPKAGGWMNNMKVVLGFIVLATTLYFINNALIQWGGGLSREIFLSIWIAIFAFNTLYILGVFKMKMDTPLETVGSVRLIFALVFATLTFYLVGGLFGMKLGEIETYLPQSEQPVMIASAAGTAQPAMQEVTGWLENYDEALALAKEENKPVFLDFTGKTCTNCKKMEKNIFPLESIRTLLDKMVKVKLITDVKEEPYISNKRMQLEKYNSVAIPLYVILTPEGEIIATEVFNNDEDEFRSFLMKAFE